RLEHHVEEIAFVTQIVIGIRVLHADAMSKSESRNRRHLRDQTIDLFTTKLDVEDVFRVRIKSRERAESRFKHAHRMGVIVKTIDDFLDVFVDECVVSDVFGPAFELSSRRQLTIKEQISDFEIRALLSQLLDRITAILQDSLVAVDESDTALARRGIHERRVVSHETEIIVRNLHLTKIHGLDRAVLNW